MASHEATSVHEHPVTHGQRALWFLAQVDPNNPTYNVHVAARIHSSLDVATLRKTFQRLVDRHGSLRSTFGLVDGQVVQRVAEHVSVHFELHSFSGTTIDEAKRFLTEAAERPFDLEHGPLFRVILLRREHDDHLLLVCAHHIVTDLASTAMLVGEMASLYTAESMGRPLELPALDVGFADFVRWQERMLVSAEGERQWEYWRKQLGGAPTSLELPFDRPRSRTGSHRGATHRFPLGSSLSRSLENLAHAEHLTLFTVFLASFQVLLHRLTGQNEIFIGSPIAARGQPEFDSVMGYFVNPVVLRGDLSDDPPFREVLARARIAILGALEHQDLPFPLLVERLAPKRDASQSPLFQVMLSVEQPRHRDRDAVSAFLFGKEGSRGWLGALELEAIHLDCGGSQFDLTLAIQESEGEWLASLEYNSDLFDAATVDAIAERYLVLLRGIVEKPLARLSALPILPERERRRLVEDWSGAETAPKCSRSSRVDGWIAARAREQPQRAAIDHDGETISYVHLMERVERLAVALRQREVGRGSVVAVAAQRSPDVVVAMLAIWRIGAVYLPLDPASPKERRDHIAAHAKAACILADRASASTLQGSPTPIFELNPAIEAPDGDPPAAPEADSPGADEPAYLIYTSGTTAEPKGVLVSHASLAHHASAIVDLYEIRSEDRVLQMANPSFDVSLEEIVPTLVAGATLVPMPVNPVASLAEFERFVRRHRITFANLTASYWHAWVAEAGAAIDPPPELRLVVVGNERVRPDCLARWKRAVGERVQLLNAYGPTEATITATVYDTARSREGDGLGVPIGRPLPGVRLYVLDGRGEPAPIGVAGEAYVGGRGVAIGYWDDAHGTRESFVPDPFSSSPRDRLYRTGDRVRWRSDGELEFLGRLDGQVKIRGHRVELEEIETVLRRHPAVADAAVVAIDLEARGTRLSAHIVLNSGAGESQPSSEALRTFLGERLPEYMVPSLFAFRDGLPRTPGGKVDRRSLAAATEFSSTSSLRRPPRTATERAIAEIWCEVLGLDEVGVDDHFFGLGGDSILSLQVVARARAKGLALTTRRFFEQPTIAALAVAAEAAECSTVDRGPVTGECPLTPIQRWLLEQKSPEPHHDNQAVLLRLREPPDPGALERALDAVLRHHDALRLRFAHDGRAWRSWFAENEGRVPISRVDVSAFEGEVLARALERESAVVQASLDLERGPLFRATLFDAGSGRSARLLLVAHHLVVDGVSWRILLEDLSLTYDRERGRAEGLLPSKTTSFQSWAQRLDHHARSETIDRESRFWEERMAIESRRLPLDRSQEEEFDSGAREASTRSVYARLDPDETRLLVAEAPRAHRSRMDDLLLAALARTLAGWGGDGPWRVDLEGHGREEVFDDVDLSRTVGWFTTLYPVILDLGLEGEHESVGDAVEVVKRELHAIPERGLGYGLLRFLGVGREITPRLQNAAAAEICFNYLGQLDRTLPEESPFTLESEPLGPCRSGRAPRPYLLEVNALVMNGRFQVEWSYSEALHERSTIERLARAFLGELRRLLPSHAQPSPSRATSHETLDRRADGASADPDVEDVYPLTPMQAGMLFHTLSDPGPGTYVEQMTWRLEGPLDLVALDAAWTRLVERHAALRTAIAWEGVEEPVQVVWRRVRVRWERLDWSRLGADEREDALEAWLRSDRERAFDLSSAPLMRLALIRLGDDLHHLVWTHHHVLLDGWSVPILLEELSMLYTSFRAGQEAALSAAFRYRDYVDWLGRRNMEEAESFWRRALRGFRVATSLPLEPSSAEPRLAERFQAVDDVYSVQHTRLSRHATAALVAFARRHALTLGTLARGAWAMLLSRYAQEDDVVFGSVSSGRPPEIPGADRGVGLFIHTLPIRVRIDAGRQGLEWLVDLQRQQLEVLRHEHAPLVQIQEWSDVPRGQPLFDTLLVFENYPLRGETLCGLEAMGALDLRSSDKTNYPITVAIAPGERLAVQIVYERRRYGADSIARLLGHFEALLAGLPRAADGALAEWPMLRDDERRRLSELSGVAARGASTYPRRTIHALVAEQAERRPDATAIVHHQRAVSYAELARLGASLASRLRSMGVGPGTRVALCMERSIEVVVGMLAVLEAGAAYVPLDPAYPQARLSFLLEDCRPVVVLAQRWLLHRLPATPATILCLDDGELDSPAPSQSPEVDVGPDDLAYVMYTSGSTGRPKGIEVTHRGIVRLVMNADWFEPSPNDVVLQVVSLSFDPSALEIWGCLIHGGKLVLHPSRTPTLDEIGEALRAHRVTSVILITGLFPLMVEERLADLAGLRRLIVGGDVMPAEAARKVLEAYPGLELINAYGPTEGTVMACAHTMTDASSVGRTVPIGRPIAHTRVHLLGRDMEPVPIGVRGEIWIAGDGLARGYHGRPDLTRERFVAAPPWIDEARLYRTGDLGRWCPDGTLEFLGRVDDQVKIRGFRIEPAEIEAALGRHPAVRECAVVAPRDARGDRRLVAYVGTGSTRPSVAELGEFLRQMLPDSMIPAAFVILDRLPLGPNGKVDRSALPDVSPQRDDARRRIPPRTPLEREIAQAWSDVLKVESPGIDDDFLDSGGHSLLATQLLARLRARVAPGLALRDLFDAPTIRALAERAARLSGPRTDSSAPIEGSGGTGGEESEPTAEETAARGASS